MQPPDWLTLSARYAVPLTSCLQIRVSLGDMRGGVSGLIVVCAAAALLAACSTAPETSTVSIPSGTGIYKVGEPYEENGVEYVPREQIDYDETGVASWYGPDFHGKLTANGEVFDEGGLTAAHPTLPMPVNVRVTNLDNGRSLVVRVNDRGPFARGRIIDVSARAAQLLGFYEKGTARVRVTYLSRADLPAGMPTVVTAAVAAAGAAPAASVQVASLDPVATEPAQTGPVQTDQAPTDEPAPVSTDPSPSSENVDTQQAPDDAAAPAASEQHYYVQAGTFAVRENAERMRDRLSAAGNLTISSIDRDGRLLYRVRIGPFDDVEGADAALVTLAGLGTSGAKVVIDQ
jgi:rare lipoprotein A